MSGFQTWLNILGWVGKKYLLLGPTPEIMIEGDQWEEGVEIAF